LSGQRRLDLLQRLVEPVLIGEQPGAVRPYLGQARAVEAAEHRQMRDHVPHGLQLLVRHLAVGGRAQDHGVDEGFVRRDHRRLRIFGNAGPNLKHPAAAKATGPPHRRGKGMARAGAQGPATTSTTCIMPSSSWFIMWQWIMKRPVKSRKRVRKVMLPLRGTTTVSSQTGSSRAFAFTWVSWNGLVWI